MNIFVKGDKVIHKERRATGIFIGVEDDPDQCWIHWTNGRRTFANMEYWNEKIDLIQGEWDK